MAAEGTTDRVLIVDDEPDLLDLLAFNFDQAGLETARAAGASEALRLAESWMPSVVVLDVMLGDGSGIDVCRRLRARETTRDVGVLMLTARGDECDRLLGFDVGADDYVVKPFSVREVVMRVRALLRRGAESRRAQGIPDTGARLQWGGLSLDPLRHLVSADGEDLMLRPLEFRLLFLFLENPGKMYSRSDLLREVWGMNPSLHTRTVDVHVRRLRASLKTYGTMIETIHGAGYRLRQRPKDT